MAFWEPVPMDGSDWQVWSVGPRTLWGTLVEDEFHLATVLADTEDPLPAPTAEPPMPVEVSRWILKREPLSVRVLPRLPNRPVVVRPESPIRFPPGRKARIYVSVPAFLCVQAIQGREVNLTELPTRELSSTWFGDPQDGVLAYALATWAQRRHADLVTSPHRVTVPVLIQNDAAEELEFRRLCVRVEHLGIYAAGDALWTGAVHVRFRGEDAGSQLRYRPGPPKEIPGAPLVSAARVPAHGNPIVRSFISLYQWAGGEAKYD